MEDKRPNLEWRIYYSDGTTFSSDDGLPKDAPAWDIQVIIQPDSRVGLRTISHKDFFLFIRGVWIGVDFTGLLDYLANDFDSVEAVKIGRMLPPEEFRNLIDIAGNDPDFPRKSAWEQGEARA